MSAGTSEMVGAASSTAVTMTVTVAEAEFAQSSVTVRTTSFGPTSSQSKEETSMERLTSPHASLEPLSMSSGVMVACPFPSRMTVKSAPSAIGDVVSSMVKVAVVVVALPQSSVAVKVTVALPVLPQSSLRAVKSLVQVTVPHSSSAVAPPLLESHPLKSAALLDPHSTVRSEAVEVRAGAVVSTISNMAVVVAALPQSSVAEKMTSTAPVPAHVRA